MLSSCRSEFVVQLALEFLYCKVGLTVELYIVTMAAHHDVRAMIKDAAWPTALYVCTLAHDVTHGLMYLHDDKNLAYR